MVVSMKNIAILIAALGVKAFVFGILAEIKKPPSGNASISDGVVTCKYPSDPSVIFGILSIVSLSASAVTGFYSIFHPYKGKSVPHKALFHTTPMVVFFNISLLVTFLAEVMLLWTTITEFNHLTNNVHHNITNTKCPTAKTGLFGGGAFIALDASLFWLVCLMLTSNAREDYFDEVAEESKKGEYGQVLIADYDQSKAQSNA